VRRLNKGEKIMSLDFPRVLRIEPAAKCNLACSHCPTGTVEMSRGIMDDSVFRRVLRELEIHKEKIKVIVLYHGGEPLLNKNLFSMICEIRNISRGFMIKTITNGMALNTNVIGKLVSSGLSEIEISLDGESSAESEEVRINSLTNKIVENIHELIEAKKCANSHIRISIASAQFLRSIKDVSTAPEVENIIPAWLHNHFKEDVEYKQGAAMMWPHMEVGELYELGRAAGEDKNYCDHIINTITVRSDGAVVPCCYDITSQLVMGNIMFESLIEIFNGERYSQLRESISKKMYESICANCNTVRAPVYLIKPASL
jgi:radical SAM protein with 4Fe4S-binding SPASM domain